MALFIQVGQHAQLVYVPAHAGLDPTLVASVAWQPQGGQTAVRFTPPDAIEGLAPGVGAYRCTVSLSTPGEKVTYAFEVECLPAGSMPIAKTVPVMIQPIAAPLT